MGNHVISQKKKVPAPDGNHHFYMYEKIGDIIRIYDSSNNLVRESYVDKNIAYVYFNKKNLLNYLGNIGNISDEIFFSKKRNSYLSTTLKRSIIIAAELGFQEKYEISKETGLSRLIYSNEYFENQPHLHQTLIKS